MALAVLVVLTVDVGMGVGMVLAMVLKVSVFCCCVLIQPCSHPAHAHLLLNGGFSRSKLDAAPEGRYNLGIYGFCDCYNWLLWLARTVSVLGCIFGYCGY